MSLATHSAKRRRIEEIHPYLSGNFAPTDQTCALTPCSYSGTIPTDLAGGQYVRNGANPVTNQEADRDAHWFDGDGMLSGVFFKEVNEDGAAVVAPEFANQFILTDVYLSATTSPTLRVPIVLSITTLVNPLSGLLRIVLSILRTVFLVIISNLPGSRHAIKKISAANTSVMYHDGRALATCESGPPLRIQLPTLDTIGWFNGSEVEGEPKDFFNPPTSQKLGGNGPLSFIKEWTTAHPKVDSDTGEMMLFHASPVPPYVEYSIIPAETGSVARHNSSKKLCNAAVPGIASPKMMHDFGVSKGHTVIMDLPLSLNPTNLMKNKPAIIYDPTQQSRFGVFPRHNPAAVRWYEAPACCIFHTANTWDEYDAAAQLTSVDMLVCRMTTASVVFNAGNIFGPQPAPATPHESLLEKTGYEPQQYSHEKTPLPGYPMPVDEAYEEGQCRLNYYSFSAASHSNKIEHQFALSVIPFEFPSVAPEKEMSSSRFVYGCSTTEGMFNSRLTGSKIDSLVKVDVEKLIARGRANPPPGMSGCVDNRSVKEIIQATQLDQDNDDPIKIFQTPPHHFAQEPRFAPSLKSKSEDAGFLLTYVFDETQLGPGTEPPPSAVSELWIIDAKGMRDILARVHLPQRVPYGLHGNWFSEAQIRGQRLFERKRKPVFRKKGEGTNAQKMGEKAIDGLIKAIGG